MKSIILLWCFLCLFFFSHTATAQQHDDPNCDDYDGPLHSHPGLSMSIDLSAISQAKDVYLSTIMKRINGLNVPNISLSGGDGYVR